MKEELTTKMHGEFTIPHADEIKHRCFSALTLIKDIDDEDEVEKYAAIYNVSSEDILRNVVSFRSLIK